MPESNKWHIINPDGSFLMKGKESRKKTYCHNRKLWFRGGGNTRGNEQTQESLFFPPLHPPTTAIYPHFQEPLIQWSSSGLKGSEYLWTIFVPTTLLWCSYNLSLQTFFPKLKLHCNPTFLFSEIASFANLESFKTNDGRKCFWALQGRAFP